MTLPTSTFIAHFFNLGGPDFVIILLIVLMWGFPIWMVVDCIQRESNEGNTKLIWILVILLAPLGSVIYFFARKLQRPSLPPPGQPDPPQ
jgi:hypothetical protein